MIEIIIILAIIFMVIVLTNCNTIKYSELELYITDYGTFRKVRIYDGDKCIFIKDMLCNNEGILQLIEHKLYEMGYENFNLTIIKT